MKKSLTILTCIFISFFSFSQESGSKFFDKKIALYQAKFFIVENIIGQNINEYYDYGKLIIDPLAAAKSSELTSIFYESVDKNVKGLVLGFYDLDYNEYGVSKVTYRFKDLEYNKALELLNKIEKIIKSERNFLSADDNENNIYFNFEDLVVIIYREGPTSGRIRIHWKELEAEWDNTAFRRTKKRFEKSL